MHDDVEYDEWCDPEHPRRIKYDDIVAASRRILGSVVRSPCTKSHMSEQLSLELFLKHEFLQHTGSFKERGVRNALLLLNEEEKQHGVICASTGNHGQAMAYHAMQLGLTCIVVMPVHAPIVKISKCALYGADCILFGNNIGEAIRHAMSISKQKKMAYINGFDHPNVIEGQGTIGLEIVEQVPAVDAILVPVGGGSLLAGVAIAVKHLKPNTEVYGICTDKTLSMAEALRKKERVYVPAGSTIADALDVPMVGVNTFFCIKGILDKVVMVTEDWVARAIMHIVEEERYVVEGAGAVCVASIMAGLFPNLKGKTVVCILSGGNIDTTILARALERGMVAEGRLVKFKVTVTDQPGGMAQLCTLMSNIGVTLRDSVPERAWVKGDVFSVELKVIAETSGWDNTKELIDTIKKNYKEYYFQGMSDKFEKSAGARRTPCLAPNPVCMLKQGRP